MSRSNLVLEKIDEIPLLVEKNLLKQGFLVAFSTRLGGVSSPPYDFLNVAFHVNDSPDSVLENRKRLFRALEMDESRPVFAEQVHGLEVARVGAGDLGKGSYHVADAISGVDALVTGSRGIPIAMLTADCVPIALVDSVKPSIAVVHAGWRGTIGRIVARAVEEMIALGSKQRDIYAYLGPSIGSCCYEVGRELVSEFRQVFGRQVTRGEKYLDLRQANIMGLTEAGVPVENIFDSGYCTSCSKDLFFSHRADGGKTGRQCVVAAILS